MTFLYQTQCGSGCLLCCYKCRQSPCQMRTLTLWKVLSACILWSDCVSGQSVIPQCWNPEHGPWWTLVLGGVSLRDAEHPLPWPPHLQAWSSLHGQPLAAPRTRGEVCMAFRYTNGCPINSCNDSANNSNRVAVQPKQGSWAQPWQQTTCQLWLSHPSISHLAKLSTDHSAI